jgi:hypothetical protein
MGPIISILIKKRKTGYKNKFLFMFFTSVVNEMYKTTPFPNTLPKTTSSYTPSKPKKPEIPPNGGGGGLNTLTVKV